MLMRSNIFAWANQHCQVVYTYRNAGTFAKFWLILRACVANCDVPEGFSTAAALITFTSEALYDSLYQLVRCVWGLPPDPRRRRLADVRVPFIGYGVRCACLRAWRVFLLFGDLHSSEVHSSYANTTSSAVIIDAQNDASDRSRG